MRTIFLVEIINKKNYPNLNDKWAFPDLDSAVRFADEYAESEIKNYVGQTAIQLSEVPFDDPDGEVNVIFNWGPWMDRKPSDMLKLTENTKVTLTVGQIKRLISESNNGADGIFHAKGLTDRGLIYDKLVDVYDNNDKKARFYAFPGSVVGIIYSRHGKISTLVPYNSKTGKRGRELSGDYKKIMAGLDGFLDGARNLED